MDKLTKATKYINAVNRGFPKQKAAVMAGYRPTGNIQAIENTKAVMEVSKTFKDAILKQLTRDEIISLLKRNAEQDKDRGASNIASKILMDRVEPQEQVQEINNKVLMIFR